MQELKGLEEPILVGELELADEAELVVELQGLEELELMQELSGLEEPILVGELELAEEPELVGELYGLEELELAELKGLVEPLLVGEQQGLEELVEELQGLEEQELWRELLGLEVVQGLEELEMLGQPQGLEVLVGESLGRGPGMTTNIFLPNVVSHHSFRSLILLFFFLAPSTTFTLAFFFFLFLSGPSLPLSASFFLLSASFLLSGSFRRETDQLRCLVGSTGQFLTVTLAPFTAFSPLLYQVRLVPCGPAMSL